MTHFEVLMLNVSFESVRALADGRLAPQFLLSAAAAVALAPCATAVAARRSLATRIFDRRRRRRRSLFFSFRSLLPFDRADFDLLKNVRATRSLFVLFFESRAPVLKFAVERRFGCKRLTLLHGGALHFGCFLACRRAACCLRAPCARV